MLEFHDFDDSEDEEFMELVGLVCFPRRCKIFQPRRDYFECLPEEDFFNRFRLSKSTVQFIIENLRNVISSPTLRNNAVTPEQKVLLTLRYYASGSMLVVCGDFIGIHKSTASRIIRLVTVALAAWRSRYINFPESAIERRKVVQEFYDIAKFPRCIGAIDCTHIRIRSPGGENAEIYRNRKKFMSINVQTVVDANARIQSIVARWPGSAHDSTIFRSSQVNARFRNGEFQPYVLVGDAGYAVSDYMLTPLQEPANQAEALYNESQIHTRNPVERSYGIWKRRFPILSVGINIKVSTAISVILATAVLHNIACFFGERVPRVSAVEEAAIGLTNFNAVPLPPDDAPNNEVQQRRLTPAQNQRNRLIQYFGSLLHET